MTAKLGLKDATLAGIVAIFLTATNIASAVTLNDGGTTNLEAVARDRNVAFPANTIDALSPLSLPFSGSHTAVVGNSSSNVEYTFTEGGFEIASSSTRDGSLDSFANAQGDIFVSVLVDTPYALSGHFTASDPTGKWISMTASLTDVDTSDVLFHNEQASFGVVDRAFVLGGMEGNQTSELSGTLNGLLLGGHRYRFHYGNSLYASNTGGLASATGAFEFAFVPEPSSITLAMSMLAALAATFRKKRS